ncbi:MAG: substrate-binding domain-containing protein [Planctomycetota bacterium]
MASSTLTRSDDSGSLSRREMVEALREHVNSGEFTDAFPLPSERMLSTRFSSHRTTVRRALMQLIDEGVLRRDGRRIMVAKPSRGFLTGTAALILPPPVSTHEPAIWQRWSQYITLNLSRSISEAGLNLLSLHPDQLTDDSLRRLSQMQPLGVLVPEVFGLNTAAVCELCEAIQRHDLRLVASGGDPSFAAFDRVASDHTHGGNIITQALIDDGKTRLAHLSGASPDVYWMRNRLAGSDEACAAAGLDRPQRVTIPTSIAMTNRDAFDAHVKAIAGSLLAAFGASLEVDALMVASDRDTYAVASAVRLFGKTPNEDVIVCGYDNVHSLCEESLFEASVPALTVDKHNDLLGKEMLDLLHGRVDGSLADEPQLRLVKPTLIRPTAG